MRAVVQRVKRAEVSVACAPVGACGEGLFILLGVMEGDNREEALLLAQKIAKLRIFSDSDGKMNLSCLDIHGEALVVSNFTLGANYAHGNRPDYLASAKPPVAEELYEAFVAYLREQIAHVETGVFGADMQISVTCDGPVTITMDSQELARRKK